MKELNRSEGYANFVNIMCISLQSSSFLPIVCAMKIELHTYMYVFTHKTRVVITLIVTNNYVLKNILFIKMTMVMQEGELRLAEQQNHELSGRAEEEKSIKV